MNLIRDLPTYLILQSQEALLFWREPFRASPNAPNEPTKPSPPRSRQNKSTFHSHKIIENRSFAEGDLEGACFLKEESLEWSFPRRTIFLAGSRWDRDFEEQNNGDQKVDSKSKFEKEHEASPIP